MNDIKKKTLEKIKIKNLKRQKSIMNQEIKIIIFKQKNVQTEKLKIKEKTLKQDSLLNIILTTLTSLFWFFFFLNRRPQKEFREIRQTTNCKSC